MTWINRMISRFGPRAAGINDDNILTPQQKKNSRRLNFWYGGVQGMFFAAICSFHTFLVLYLKSNGYSDFRIGLIMTLMSVIGVISPTLMGYIADFYIPVKVIVIVMMILSIPLAFFVQASIAIFPLALIAILLTGIAEKSMGSVIDSWGMRLRNEHPYLNYGATRGLGSLLYASMALIAGKLYDVAGLDKMFWLHAVVAALCVIAALMLDNVKTSPRKVGQSSFFATVRELLRIRKYTIFLVSMVLHGFSMVVIGTFQPILIANHGGTSVHLGISSFMLAASEVPIMFSATKLLRRFKVESLLTVSFTFAALRLLLTVLAPTLELVIAVQVLQALSFGLYLPALLFYVSLITPDHAQSTAITLATSVGFGLSGITGNFFGGILAENFGVEIVYYIFSFLAVCGLVIFRISQRKPARTGARL